MQSAIIGAVVVAAGIWVYWDATEHGIGRIPGNKGFLNMPAGAWSILTMVVWFVGLVYLVKRASLMQLAELQPVRVAHRNVKLFLIIFVGISFVASRIWD